MLLSMVALDTPSLPRQQEMLETLASLSGATVNPKTVEAKESSLGVPAWRQHGRRGPRAGADSLVESGRSL